jgi:hypothetical protein
MGIITNIFRISLVRLGIYVMPLQSQAAYASIRSVMHHLLSVLSTYRRERVYKIDSYIFPYTLWSAAAPFLLLGFASSVIETECTHGDGFASL